MMCVTPPPPLSLLILPLSQQPPALLLLLPPSPLDMPTTVSIHPKKTKETEQREQEGCHGPVLLVCLPACGCVWV